MRWPVQKPYQEGESMLRLLIEIPTSASEEGQQALAADVARRIRLQVSKKAMTHRAVPDGWVHVEPAKGI